MPSLVDRYSDFTTEVRSMLAKHMLQISFLMKCPRKRYTLPCRRVAQWMKVGHRFVVVEGPTVPMPELHIENLSL